MIIFKAALKRILSNKISFVLILILPLLAIYMWAFRDYDGSTVGFIDNDHSGVSERIRNLLEASDGIKLMSTDMENARDLTESYAIDYTVIIEPGFEKALLNGGHPKLKEFYLEDKQKHFFIRSLINQETNNLYMLADSTQNDKTLFEKALREYVSNLVTISSKEATADRNSRTRLALGFLVQFMLYMSVVTNASILEDKVKGTFYRTFCTPVTLKRYMMENLLAFLIIGVLQSFFIIFVLKLVFNMYLGVSLFGLLAVFMVFSLVCVSLGLLITSLLKKPFQAYVIIFILTTPLVMLGGCYWDTSVMPDVMTQIGKFIPTTWVMKSVDALLSGAFNWGTLISNCGMLLVFFAIFLAGGLMKKVDMAKS